MVQIIIIVILTCINAFFASAEMAMVSINRNRLSVLVDEGDKRAQLLEGLLLEPSKLLATIQVGITLAGFFSSAFAATGLSVHLGEWLSGNGVPYGDQIALVLITIMLSFVMLLFGELFPKRLALQKAEIVALASVRPVYYISRGTKPFVKLLSWCTNLLIRLVGIDQDNLDQKISEEEIRSMVKVGQEFGVINQTEKQMINAIFEFDDKLAREVMTPRTEVKMVDLLEDRDQVLDALIQLKYSRIPVYEKDRDKVVGVIHLKDLLSVARNQGFDGVHLKGIARAPYYVPETMAIDRLFIQLQRDHEHMALLIDEYGLMTGIVTMEDLIEEVMGNIEDEFDEHEKDVEIIPSGGYRVKGGLTLFEFNDYFHAALRSEKADTIAGFLVGLKGKMPKDLEGQVLIYGGFSFKIEEVIGKRIHTVIVNKVTEKAIES